MTETATPIACDDCDALAGQPCEIGCPASDSLEADTLLNEIDLNDELEFDPADFTTDELRYGVAPRPHWTAPVA